MYGQAAVCISIDVNIFEFLEELFFFKGLLLDSQCTLSLFV